jgi:hypothetical protein
MPEPDVRRFAGAAPEAMPRNIAPALALTFEAFEHPF